MGHSGGPTARNFLIDSACKIRLRDLTGGDRLRPGSRHHGQMTWSRHGERIAAVAFMLQATSGGGELRLVYSATVRATGERVDQDYVIPLVTTEQPGGGVRYWFWCERARAMATTLYLMPGSTVFASRRAFRRVAYRSQRVSPLDRHLERARAIRAALGGDANLTTPFPERPARMWQSTYLRKRAEAEAEAGAYLALMEQRLGRMSLDVGLGERR